MLLFVWFSLLLQELYWVVLQFPVQTIGLKNTYPESHALVVRFRLHLNQNMYIWVQTSFQVFWVNESQSLNMIK